MQDIRELIELWDRADRAREEIENYLELVKFRLQVSGALISRRSAQRAETENMVARSRVLLARTAGRRLVSELPNRSSPPPPH